jgi:hypothetical protein
MDKEWANYFQITKNNALGRLDKRFRKFEKFPKSGTPSVFCGIKPLIP